MQDAAVVASLVAADGALFFYNSDFGAGQSLKLRRKPPWPIRLYRRQLPSTHRFDFALPRLSDTLVMDLYAP